MTDTAMAKTITEHCAEYCARNRKKTKPDPPECLSTILGHAEVREVRARGAERGWTTLAEALLGTGDEDTETENENAPPLQVVASGGRR